MREVESRLGIEPIDKLLAERYALVERVADLRARHGAFGTWDHARKILLATVAMKARALAVRDGTKVTEGALEDLAHASPEYTEMVTQATLDRSELTLLEAKIEAIDATIMRANAITRFAASEARL
jgi:chorismate mutase